MVYEGQTGLGSRVRDGKELADPAEGRVQRRSLCCMELPVGKGTEKRYEGFYYRIADCQ